MLRIGDVFFGDEGTQRHRGSRSSLGRFWGNKRCLLSHNFLGFLGGGRSRGGGNWGTHRIPREDWGTLGNIRND